MKIPVQVQGACRSAINFCTDSNTGAAKIERVVLLALAALVAIKGSTLLTSLCIGLTAKVASAVNLSHFATFILGGVIITYAASVYAFSNYKAPL